MSARVSPDDTVMVDHSAMVQAMLKALDVNTSKGSSSEVNAIYLFVQLFAVIDWQYPIYLSMMMIAFIVTEIM